MNIKEYGEHTWNLVKESNILEEEDFAVIDRLQDELVENFKKAQVFRTRTEMEISVLDDMKHPTPDAKYWQAVREQNVMYNELVMLSYEYRKNLVEVKRLKRDMDKSRIDPLDIELMQIELEKMQFVLKQQERTAKDRIREIQEWHEIKEDLKKYIKYGTEDVDKHQLTSYTKRFANQASIMGESGSLPERQNLLGQLHTSLQALEKKGGVEELKLLKKITNKE